MFIRSLDGGLGRPLGRVEFICGKTLSFKTVCEHASHQLVDVSSSSNAIVKTLAQQKNEKQCYCLLHATHGTFEKYERVLEWLLHAHDQSREEHMRAAAAVKSGFRN